MKGAQEFKRHVENLRAARIAGHAIDTATARWLADRPLEIRHKLAGIGLIQPPEEPKDSGLITLKEFLDGYFERRTDAKPSSKIVWSHARRNLIDFFGADRPLASITRGHAEDFERYLKKNARLNAYSGIGKADSLSPDTIRKRIGIAKQFFTDAINRELLERNPFAKLESTVRGNRKRDFNVTPDMAAKLILACPDAQWRLIIALSRFGGLRCPSEHLALKLSDVNWEANTMRVRSPKTEHHHEKDYRDIPLFDELKPYLREVAAAAAKDDEYFITRYRDASQNLRTTLLKIIKRAGLQPWPKLFHNMRATRQTELEARFPLHVVCAWIGNSPQVAKKHYLQVTDEHLERVKGINLLEGALQKALQQDAVSDGNELQTNSAREENAEKIVILAEAARMRMDDEGLEPPTSTL